MIIYVVQWPWGCESDPRGLNDLSNVFNTKYVRPNQIISATSSAQHLPTWNVMECKEWWDGSECELLPEFKQQVMHLKRGCRWTLCNKVWKREPFSVFFLFLHYHQKVGNLDSRQPVEYSSYPIMYITQQYTVLNSNKLFSLYIDFLIYRYIDRERAYSYCGCWKRTRHII